MIFVTVGSSDCDFSRLISKIDQLVSVGCIADVVVQIGNSKYTPKACHSIRFAPQHEIVSLIEKSEFVICHGGTGTIDMVLGLRKKTIVVPRMKKFGEITDDHQLELAELLEKAGRVLVVKDIKDIEDCLVLLPAWEPSFRADTPRQDFEQFLCSHIRKLLHVK
jgi:beta-1,4-N-acetylglucosaminyltransferase